ncbi:MAG: LysM peptidoglycan-binding domain-containing protein [Deltaproteobacteria bacterium]|nr:LysM peptidoglycan-binding domain-containing protein [Deltaproteobacteria bacterium]
MKKIKIQLFKISLFFFVTAILYSPLSIAAEKMTHTVIKGDTLWDICERYYGDNSVWPKLWEMNSFITNPHLLIPGDVITLYEISELIAQPEKTVPEVAKAEEPSPFTGIDIHGIINTNKMGFYSSEKIDTWGTLFASSDKNIILSKDDTVYVIFENTKKINTGDEFSIGKVSQRVIHPVTKEKSGYVFDVSGKLVIEKKTGFTLKEEVLREKENVYQAKITEAHTPINIDDIILPLRVIPGCILPESNSGDILANIVAAEHNLTLIHQYNLIYMDKGSNAGIKNGNVFEIVESNIVKDPKPEKILKVWEEMVILPDRHFGIAMVIDTYPDTATAIVLVAPEQIETGAYMKSVSWTEIPDYISAKANCSAQ